MFHGGGGPYGPGPGGPDGPDGPDGPPKQSCSNQQQHMKLRLPNTEQQREGLASKSKCMENDSALPLSNIFCTY